MAVQKFKWLTIGSSVQLRVEKHGPTKKPRPKKKKKKHVQKKKPNGLQTLQSFQAEQMITMIKDRNYQQQQE